MITSLYIPYNRYDPSTRWVARREATDASSTDRRARTDQDGGPARSRYGSGAIMAGSASPAPARPATGSRKSVRPLDSVLAAVIAPVLAVAYAVAVTALKLTRRGR